MIAKWTTSATGREKPCSDCGKKTIGRVDGKPLCYKCTLDMRAPK